MRDNLLSVNALLSTILLLLLSPTASAWGEVTHEYVCRKALEGVYTLKDVEGCLGDADLEGQTAFCHAIREYVDEESYMRCIDETYNKVVIKPYTLPYVIFNDTEKHKDYSKCPITHLHRREWICGNENKTPATDNAEHWIKAAESATTKCDRIKMLCIASNYYADAYYPLNQVKHLTGCFGSLEEQVDGKIKGGELGWNVEEYCTFEYQREDTGITRTVRYQQAFVIKEDYINMISSNLSKIFKTVAEKPLTYVEPELTKKTRRVDAVETKVGVTNTSITWEDITQKKVEKEDYVNQTLTAFNEMLENVEGALKSLGGMPSEVAEGRQSKNIPMAVFIITVVLFSIAFMAYITLRNKTGRPKKPWDIVEGEVDLKKITGVTEKIAYELRKAGYLTVEDVARAPKDKLKKIPEINQSNARKISNNAKKLLSKTSK